MNKQDRGAGLCQWCDEDGKWRYLRIGDVAVSWSCDEHSSEVMRSLQRDHEVTKLQVTDYVKGCEWHEIRQSLKAVERESLEGL